MEQRPHSGTGKEVEVIVETVLLWKGHRRDSGYQLTVTYVFYFLHFGMKLWWKNVSTNKNFKKRQHVGFNCLGRGGVTTARERETASFEILEICGV